ncbi:TetR/AcrR family transcriptional regulator [Mycobacterium sp. NPDC050551]|uniref:TetR/AcrR family transcriptional regulator n=1 Tax=Mycobacterium sp. NPDC050551 TaxID=3155407 RepID=UPI0034366496
MPLRDRLCVVGIDHFGRFGFDQSLLELSIAADVDVSTLTEMFGSVEGMRRACDDFLMSSIRRSKTDALTSRDPGSWLAQLKNIESYAPMLTYLIRSLEDGERIGHTLLQQMSENAEEYLEAAVRAGTVKSSHDTSGRARLVVMFGAGGFLLYRRMHQSPDDMGAVLRDYARDLVMPALEMYTYGLMTDDNMYQAFLAAAANSER